MHGCAARTLEPASHSRRAGSGGCTSTTRATAGGSALDGRHKVLHLPTPRAEASAEATPVRLLEGAGSSAHDQHTAGSLVDPALDEPALNRHHYPALGILRRNLRDSGRMGNTTARGGGLDGRERGLRARKAAS